MSAEPNSMAHRIDFETMRKACEPDEENERELASGNSPMKARQAVQILYRGMVQFDRAEVTDSYLCKETISWRLEREGWTAVRWVTVTEYAPGLLRLRNDVLANVPRRIWPFPLPRPCRRPFELTLHWTEFTHDLGGEVYEFCNAAAEPNFQHEWRRFEGEQTYPQYAWSALARRVQELRSR